MESPLAAQGVATSSPSWAVPLFSGGAPSRGDWRTSAESQGCVSLTSSQDVPPFLPAGRLRQRGANAWPLAARQTRWGSRSLALRQRRVWVMVRGLGH